MLLGSLALSFMFAGLIVLKLPVGLYTLISLLQHVVDACDSTVDVSNRDDRFGCS